MASRAENPGHAGDVRAPLLADLRTRLEEAHSLSEKMRASLRSGSFGEIDAMTARLETAALEFKLLVEEYKRAHAGVPTEDETVLAAKRDLESAAAHLARSSAISGGVLERMVTIRRGLLALVADATGEVYESTGRAKELAPRGVRLRQQA
jgi:hypothetical protein